MILVKHKPSAYDELMAKSTKKTRENIVRNLIFGVEDSLVSTVGFVSGVAVAGLTGREVILTGTILIVVEAFSMGVGSYLSEDAAEEFIDNKKGASSSTLVGAIIMFVSYIFSGLIPLSPYLFFTPNFAIIPSVILSCLSLFLLGAISARYFHRNSLKHGVKMFVIGGIAIAAGILIGQVA